MQIKRFKNDEDYQTLLSWCQARNWPEINKDMLSDYGYIVSENDKKIATCWLYPVIGSSVCWMGFPFSNPNSNKYERKKALDLLFENMHNTAKNMGYTYILTTSNTPPIENRLKKYGYKLGDKNVNQYWGRLK